MVHEREHDVRMDAYCHRDKNIHLVVQQPSERFWVSVDLVARIPMSSDEIFEIITSPHNHEIFNSVSAPRKRKVVRDDGRGRQDIDMEQVGRWRFGPFRGSFGVRLKITQDRRKHSMVFELHPKAHGFMKQFSGNWKIFAYDAELEDRLLFPDKKRSGFHGWHRFMHEIEESLSRSHRRDSLVKLHQSVQPGFLPPPPMDRVLRKIAAAQVQSVMTDLMREAEKRASMTDAERDRRRARFKEENDDQQAARENRWTLRPFVQAITKC